MNKDDTLLHVFFTMKKEVKVLEKRLELLKEEILNRGSFSTDNYICVITNESRTSIKALDEVIKVVGRELLEEYDLIQTTTFQKLTVGLKSS